MSKNDITGDKLISRTYTKSYEDNYDLIFKKVAIELDSLALDIEDTTVGHKRYVNDASSKHKES